MPTITFTKTVFHQLLLVARIKALQRRAHTESEGDEKPTDEETKGTFDIETDHFKLNT